MRHERWFWSACWIQRYKLYSITSLYSFFIEPERVQPPEETPGSFGTPDIQKKLVDYYEKQTNFHSFQGKGGRIDGKKKGTKGVKVSSLDKKYLTFICNEENDRFGPDLQARSAELRLGRKDAALYPLKTKNSDWRRSWSKLYFICWLWAGSQVSFLGNLTTQKQTDGHVFYSWARNQDRLFWTLFSRAKFRTGTHNNV